jgi:cysteine desulfurase / selenocysteine lyase
MALNLEKIRNDFPLLGTKVHGKPPIYFDNACASLRPQVVIDAVKDYYEKYSVCGGRSKYQLADVVSQKMDAARVALSKFIGAKQKEEIVFTRNTTEGINLVAYGLDWKPGDVVLTSDKEHNSNLLPWQILAQTKGIIHRIVHTHEDGTFDLASYENALKDGSVKLVAMGSTSNLDGVSFPMNQISALAHKHGAKVLFDAAQTVPSQVVNVAKLDVDFMAFSGHKMLGPSGMGALYTKYSLLEQLTPFMVGGSTVEYTTYTDHKFLRPPEKFEAGLQDYAGIIGFGEAVKYLQAIGLEAVARHELELNTFLTSELIKIPRLKIIGPADPTLRGGILTFTVEGVDPHQIAMMADEMAGIMIRSGQHCVHSWFNAKKIHSAARASLYFYNTMDECHTFAETLKKIISLF